MDRYGIAKRIQYWIENYPLPMTDLSSLDARYAAIVTARYGLDGKPPQTFVQIGKDWDISAERAHQICQRARQQLAERKRCP